MLINKVFEQDFWHSKCLSFIYNITNEGKLYPYRKCHYCYHEPSYDMKNQLFLISKFNHNPYNYFLCYRAAKECIEFKEQYMLTCYLLNTFFVKDVFNIIFDLYIFFCKTTNKCTKRVTLNEIINALLKIT